MSHFTPTAVRTGDLDRSNGPWDLRSSSHTEQRYDLYPRRDPQPPPPPTPPPPTHDASLEPIIESFVTRPPISKAVQFLQDGLLPDVPGNYTLPTNLDPHNPYTYEQFLDGLSVLGNYSFLVDKCSYGKKERAGRFARNVEEEPEEDYFSLRSRQNADYALRCVKEGIEAFQEGDFERALKKYRHALEQDARCAEAYVARGAVHVKQEKYTKAIADFEHALKVDPRHANAAIYLAKTRKRVAELEQEKQSAARGEFLMPVDYDPRHPTHPAALSNKLAHVRFRSAESSTTELMTDPDPPAPEPIHDLTKRRLVSPPPTKREKRSPHKKDKKRKKKKRRRQSVESLSSSASERHGRDYREASLDKRDKRRASYTFRSPSRDKSRRSGSHQRR
ncbi:uncharacterized protein SPPG_01947 [Spizellomyces punctatus DAOM BR117]|uniref:Uncharacterized protein n=1 Tax=Spizellomyces punctatus (strain DAOM BR117) TaxID=645134 RepID=A0A0L0HP41_SPIPD|nr:uncharacterized protein SPPG_01947 [Spizellomyces punctatus DAOM BR117]KND02867.1 hypothetical protein SPPG_01947 [Spizellomyces punctatus DAOM BR117]|eukprot:XP_016610906.1 hypothetical protein SPPG_01947 [Spizellomyces punctatus DAOM BR117]